jgi:SHS2 domain-containing protein
MVAYRLLDHTADLGFECEAASREALFETAALALADIMARTDALGAKESVSIRVQGRDDVARLHALLDEVLFQFEKSAFLPREASVRFEGDSVLATLRGEKVDLATFPIERVVKAVTYHELEVEERDGLFSARVILDL